MENIIYTISITPPKKLIKSSVFFLVVITFLYVFSLGSVMNAVVQKKELTDVLERESQHLFSLEAKGAQENIWDLNLFLKLGYAESQKPEIIKTSRNVASIQAPRN